MTLEPLGQRVLVELVAQEEVTPGGIVMPSTVQQEAPNEGTVVAVGDEVEKVKVGDQIIFERFSATKVVVDRKELCVLELKNVIGVYR
jgi:chaperonin GroES